MSFNKLVSAFILMLFITPVLAIHSVEELWEQGEQSNAAVAELKTSVEEYKASLENGIKDVGVMGVVMFISAYIALTCFHYLFVVFWNYRNKRVLKAQRDEYVKDLGKQIGLLQVEQVLLKQQVGLLRENNMSLQMLNKPRKPDYFVFLLPVLVGIIVIAMTGRIFPNELTANIGVGVGLFCIFMAVASFISSRSVGKGKTDSGPVATISEKTLSQPAPQNTLALEEAVSKVVEIVQVSEPVAEKIEEPKKMDLPDIESVFEEPKKEDDKTDEEEMRQMKVLEYLRTSSPTPLKTISNDFGYGKDRSLFAQLMCTVRELRKKGLVTCKEDPTTGKNLWSVKK